MGRADRQSQNEALRHHVMHCALGCSKVESVIDGDILT